METTEFERRFGTNIQYLRTKYFLSQRSMAALLGIGIKTLRKIENGQHSKRADTYLLFRLCEIFCVSADAIMHEDLQKMGVLQNAQNLR